MGISQSSAPLPTAPRGPLAAGRPLWRRMSPLARDITVVLVIKAVVLGGLWLAFFRAPAAPRMSMDPRQVEFRVVAPPPATEVPVAIR
jgi:hypothetical protein